MTFLYNVGIALYSILINIVAPFNQKAKLLKDGRKETWKKLKNLSIDGPVVWIHAASLGEFEQGRPIIEALKKTHPHYKIVLTFFSPSGYEVRKNYELADHVFYLPSDTFKNASRFINAIKPGKVFFVKYEFWYHFLKRLKANDTHVYGVSMIFRKQQSFFRWYGSWFKQMLSCFQKFYVQDEVSGDLLKQIDITNYSVVGDTRFDRVRDIAKASAEVKIADQFAGDSNKVIVAGSTWGPDEEILIRYIQDHSRDVKIIIAPHEIHEEHLKQIEAKLSVPFFRYTQAPKDVSNHRVMIVDTIGMLSSIYKYGQIAYIGGGFGKGIHNTLEAATYSMPVFFGPNYKKFKEARDLIEEGAAYTVKDEKEFINAIEKLWSDDNLLKTVSNKSGAYVHKMCGATKVILEEIFV